MRIVKPIPLDTPGSTVEFAGPEAVDRKPEGWAGILSKMGKVWM